MIYHRSCFSASKTIDFRPRFWLYVLVSSNNKSLPYRKSVAQISTVIALLCVCSCEEQKPLVNAKTKVQPFSPSLQALAQIPRTNAIMPVDTDSPENAQPKIREVSVSIPGGTRKFKVADREIDSQLASAFVNNPSIVGSIFPGSLLWWNDLNSGAQFNPVSGGAVDKPFKLLMSGANLKKDSKPVVSLMVNGSSTSFAEALAELKCESIATNIEYRVVETDSIEAAALKIGMAAKYLSFAKASGSYQKATDDRQSAVVVTFKQIFFTAGVDVNLLPRLGGPLALRTWSEADDAALCADIERKKSELVYISDVAYGRTVFMILTSKNKQTDLAAAANAGGGYLGFSAEASIDKKHQDVLSDAAAQVIIVGSNSPTAALGEIFSAPARDVGVKMRKFLQESSTLESLAQAVPLTFSARYVRDNEMALITDSAKYSEWRPYQTVYVGQQKEHVVSLDLPGPGYKLAGDSEIDSDDSGVHLHLNIKAARDISGTGFSLAVNYTAQEKSKSFAKVKDTRQGLDQTFYYSNLVDNGFQIELPSLDMTTEKKHKGKEFGFVRLPPLAVANDIDVRFDGSGDGDHRRMAARLKVRIPYMVKERTVSDTETVE